MYIKKYLYTIPLICLLPTITTASQILSQNTVRNQLWNLIITNRTLSTATAVGTVGALAFCIYRWHALPSSSVTIGGSSGPTISQGNARDLERTPRTAPGPGGPPIDTNLIPAGSISSERISPVSQLSELEITQLKRLLDVDGVDNALEGSKKLHALFQTFIESPAGAKAIETYIRSPAGHWSILNPLGAVITERGRITFPEATILSGEHARALTQVSKDIKELQRELAAVRAALDAKAEKNIINSLSEKIIALEGKIKELEAQTNHLLRQEETRSRTAQTS